MKKIKQLYIFVSLLLSAVSNSQKKIGDNPINVTTSAVFEIESTTKGFLPPRMTQTQMMAISSPAIGLITYCIDCNPVGLRVFDGTVWNTSFGFSSIISPTVSVTAISPIHSATGKIWMDRNLGASRKAQNVNDNLAYGQLYQWGRGNDGHADMIWTSATSGVPVNGTTSTLSSTDNPENNLFITSSNDWRTSQNDNLWQGTNSVNNPCPTNYRLPSNTELSAEVTTYNITNSTSAFASPLKFTTPGYRYLYDGTINTTGSHGYYWTSSANGNDASGRVFSNGTYTFNLYRAFGFTVRCVKD